MKNWLKYRWDYDDESYFEKATAAATNQWLALKDKNLVQTSLIFFNFEVIKWSIYLEKSFFWRTSVFTEKPFLEKNRCYKPELLKKYGWGNVAHVVFGTTDVF